MLLDDREALAARTPMPTQDVTSATKKLSVTGETVTFTDGAAGTTQQIKLDYDGIMSSKRDRIGQKGDSSLSFTTGTVLTTEVPWRFKDHLEDDNDTARLATMASGEFMVDYENGYILGKNAITTSSTTDTVSYGVRLLGAIADVTLTGDGDEVSTKPTEPSTAHTTDLAASLVVKSSAGTLYELRGYNDSSSEQFIQIHDSASTPSEGNTPKEVIIVPASSNFSITFPQGRAFTSGIFVCNSSQAATKVIGGANCWFAADYI